MCGAHSEVGRDVPDLRVGGVVRVVCVGEGGLSPRVCCVERCSMFCWCRLCVCVSGERCSPEWGGVSPVLFGRTGRGWCVVGVLAVCAPEHYGGDEGGVLGVQWMCKCVCLSYACVV